MNRNELFQYEREQLWKTWTSIILNNERLNAFPIKWITKQEYLLRLLLFIVISEMLASEVVHTHTHKDIRKESSLKGNITLSLFKDDITI